MTDTATAEQAASPTPAPEDDGWTWAIVEVFGHRRHVGRSREEEKFGSKLCRIDVPKLGPGPDEITWSSHFYGGSAIFSFTPTDERTVMKYAERAYTPAIPFRDHGDDDDDHDGDSDDPESGFGIETDPGM
jgi:hypothetical protein